MHIEQKGFHHILISYQRHPNISVILGGFPVYLHTFDEKLHIISTHKVAININHIKLQLISNTKEFSECVPECLSEIYFLFYNMPLTQLIFESAYIILYPLETCCIYNMQMCCRGLC